VEVITLGEISGRMKETVSKHVKDRDKKKRKQPRQMKTKEKRRQWRV
jgi:hypothetical protein